MAFKRQKNSIERKISNNFPLNFTILQPESYDFYKNIKYLYI